MKAKKKPLDTIPVADFGVDITPQMTATHWAPPAKREKGTMVASVDELIAALKAKGLVS